MLPQPLVDSLGIGIDVITIAYMTQGDKRSECLFILAVSGSQWVGSVMVSGTQIAWQTSKNRNKRKAKSGQNEGAHPSAVVTVCLYLVLVCWMKMLIGNNSYSYITLSAEHT